MSPGESFSHSTPMRSVQLLLPLLTFTRGGPHGAMLNVTTDEVALYAMIERRRRHRDEAEQRREWSRDESAAATEKQRRREKPAKLSAMNVRKREPELAGEERSNNRKRSNRAW